MFSKHITRLLKIYPNDTTNLINLALLNMLLVSVHSFGTSIVTSLFIKRYGVDNLPKMYLVSALAIVICTLLVLRLSSIKRNTLLSASCMIFGVLVIAARILLHFDITVACPVLYVLGDLAAWTFYTQFWALAVETCDVREGKRIFTYVVCAGLMGGVMAGAGVSLLIRSFGNNDLLTLWAVLFFAVVLYLRMIASQSSSSCKEADKETELPFLGQLKDTAFYFTKSSHVRILMVCVLLAAISANFVDFIFNKIMDNAFPDENKLTAFYGTYSLFYYSGTLIVQLFITNRVVKFLGTGSSLLLLPAWVSFGLGSLIASFGYFTGVCTKFFKDVISSSFSETTFPLLFSPLKDNFRNSIMAISEGLVTPLGTAFAGGILILISNRSNYTIVLTSMAFAFAWIYFGFLLKNSYQSAFISNLAAKSLPDISAIEDSGNMSEEQALLLLSHALKSDDDNVSYFAMRTLAQSQETSATDILLHYLADKPSNARKANLLYFLGRMQKNDKCLTVTEHFLNDPAPLVRAKAVGTFLSVNNTHVRDIILPCLDDMDLRVRINAVMVLWKFGARKEFVEILSSAVQDPSEDIRSWTGFALRQINSTDSMPFLLALSHDCHLKVKIEAIKGLGQLDCKEANARLIEMLHDENREIRHYACKSLIKKEGVSNLIIDKYETSGHKIREQLIHILAARKEGKDIVFRYLEDELASIYKRIVWTKTLRLEKQNTAIELFIATLINRNRRSLDNILRVSSSIEGSTAFGLIVKRLKDKDSRSFAEVLELLDTMTLHKKSFLKSIISLLEEIPENELAEYAHKDLGIKEYSALDIYRECLQDPSEEWFKGCALYILSMTRSKHGEAIFKKHLLSPSLFIQQLCQEALQPEAL